jgi:hypothetical protein
VSNNLSMINQPTHKLTDEEFLDAYMECNGNCAETARYIMLNYNIYYTRQSVHERAKKFPEVKLQLQALLADRCEEGLIHFADDKQNDIRLRVRLYLHLQNTIHKNFGVLTYFNNVMKNKIS